MCSLLNKFISHNQLRIIRALERGEEGRWFTNRLAEIEAMITTMPHTYQQDGKGDDAIAYLHYFCRGWDWWITEKDVDGGIDQAFGLASCGIDAPEIGYISIRELTQVGAELDLHFTPARIGDIKAKAAVQAAA